MSLLMIKNGERNTTLENQLDLTSPLNAATPWKGVSENYRFISTAKILELAESAGFEVHKVNVARVKSQDKLGFQSHRVDLIHRDFKDLNILGDSIPRVSIVNSHDRTKSFSLSIGFFRLICENGLVVGDLFGGVNLKRIFHCGQKDLEKTILERISAALADFPRLIELQKSMRETQLDYNGQLLLARLISDYVKDQKGYGELNHFQLLNARRDADTPNDLWTVVNRIQENIVKGNYVFRSNTTGQLRKARALKSIDADLKFNKYLMDQAQLILDTRKAA